MRAGTNRTPATRVVEAASLDERATRTIAFVRMAGSGWRARGTMLGSSAALTGGAEAPAASTAASTGGESSFAAELKPRLNLGVGR